MANFPATNGMPDGLAAFYRAENELVRALQLMGEAARHVVELPEMREHAARLRLAVQALAASAADTLRTGDSRRPFPSNGSTAPMPRDPTPEAAPGCVAQVRNAAMDSVHSFAHIVGQDQVVELLEHTDGRRPRPTRKPRWPGPLKRLGRKS